MSDLCEVSIRSCCGIFDTLKVFTFDKGLDALLDHVDIGFELCSKLGEGLGDELLV